MPKLVYTSTAEDTAFGKEFLNQIVQYIADNFDPEDVFDEDTLDDWAEENGWSQEES